MLKNAVPDFAVGRLCSSIPRKAVSGRRWNEYPTRKHTKGIFYGSDLKAYKAFST
jgi:hypothetical protein